MHVSVYILVCNAKIRTCLYMEICMCVWGFVFAKRAREVVEYLLPQHCLQKGHFIDKHVCMYVCVSMCARVRLQSDVVLFVQNKAKPLWLPLSLLLGWP